MAGNATRSGELLCKVAASIFARDLHAWCVCHPELKNVLCLEVTGPGDENCNLVVGDTACIEWDYSPPAGGADPRKIADLAAMLLSGSGREHLGKVEKNEYKGITFKGIVGRELKSRGLDVSLSVYEDTEFYEVTSEIVVSNPGTGEGSKVWIADNGHVTWKRDYWREAAVITHSPGFSWYFSDAGKLADVIADAVTRATSYVLPGTGA